MRTMAFIEYAQMIFDGSYGIGLRPTIRRATVGRSGGLSDG